MSVTWDDSKFVAKIEAQTNRGLDRSAEFIRNYVVRSFVWQKSGKMPPYRITKAGKTIRTKGVRGGKYKGWLRQRSAPGEPPAVQLGWLREHIHWVRVEPFKRRIGVYGDVPYALPLEIGTSRMAARPFLRPALFTCLDKVREFLGQRMW